ncbi:MAG TPA: hypothetical protein VGE57_00565 [Solimonas sp.]
MTKNLTPRNLALGLAFAGSLGVSSIATAKIPTSSHIGGSAPVVTHNITEADVLAAQRAWGAAVVQIATEYDTQGLAKAKATADAVLDSAYAYQYGPVLFKPTLAAMPQNIRTTKEGALAYFVGDDKSFPDDKGFALKSWRKVEFKNAAIQLHGDTALSIGNVSFTDKTGKVTTVDKSFGYVRDDQGALRIVLHHSSLPFSN